jgi:hypothetical protein
VCFTSNIVDANSVVSCRGDPFLRNVVATFHTDSEMVSFIERAPY